MFRTSWVDHQEDSLYMQFCVVCTNRPPADQRMRLETRRRRQKSNFIIIIIIYSLPAIV